MLRRCHRGVLQPRAPAPHDALACRCISANTHPDHRTLAAFRKRFLNELAGLFTAVRRIAPAMGLLTLGTVSRAGTTRTAHARQHQALSCAHANRLEAQLKNAVEQRMRLAEQADHEPRPAPVDIPLELKRRAPRRAVIAAAKEEIEARAPARCEAEAHAHRLRTREGKARHAKRCATVETVFGIIKHVPGCRQFLRRGLRAVPGEWALGCMGGHLKRLLALKG